MKAYVVTRVAHTHTAEAKAKVVGIDYDRNEAEKTKLADMREYHSRFCDCNIFAYDEDDGSLVFKEGEMDALQWEVEEVDIRIPLTPLQVSNLNLLALNIAGNPKSFADFENLSDEERAYLVDNLKNTYHIDVGGKE